MSDDPPRPSTAPDSVASAQANRELFGTLYSELRRLADRAIRRQPGVALSPTTLVHEVYVNFAGRAAMTFEEHGQFLAYAARAMRGLLIDFARNRQALKRGAGFHITLLDTQIADNLADERELVRLSEALDELAEVDPRLAEVVDLKYFCGFSFAEIAAMRGISERTVQREWDKARLLLYTQLSDADPA